MNTNTASDREGLIELLSSYETALDEAMAYDPLLGVQFSALVASDMTPDEIVTAARARQLHLVNGRVYNLPRGGPHRRISVDATVVETVLRDGTVGGVGLGTVFTTEVWGPLVLARRAATLT